MFDWQAFLDRYSIEYITEGHNARRHVIAVKCPFCGDDPSFHLGISTRGRGFHCWRNETQHSGKAPHRLIMALINCTFDEADRIVKTENVSFATSDETFAEDVFRHLGIRNNKAPPRINAGKLEFLPEFRRIDDSGRCRQLIIPYLNKRDYIGDDINWLFKRYRLRWAATGKFAYRIIIPVYMDKQLVNWTGRTVARGEGLRYRSLSTDPEKAANESLPPAKMNIKDCLFDFDRLVKGGETLVVCEGPFDAIRVTYFGEEYGIRGTCLFNKSASPAQIDLLTEVVLKYRNRFAVFDEGADLDAFLSFPDFLGFQRKMLPRDVKDPALLDERGFNKVFELAA